MLRTNLTWWKSKINSMVLRLPIAVGTLYANAQLGPILGSFRVLLFTLCPTVCVINVPILFTI